MSERPLISDGPSGPVSLPDETQFAANGIVSRTLLNTPQTRVVLFGFAAGQELTEHSTPREALVQILSGRCDFRVREAEYRLKDGDFLHLPAGVPHAVRAVEAFSMLITLIKVPG